MQHPQPLSPTRTFFLGTDWWTDCDDCVALRILARAVLAGKVSLAGVTVNACMEYSVASLDGFLASEGLNGIPIGIDTDATDFGGTPPYQKRLAQYARTYRSNADAEDALRLYRRVLEGAKNKIELIEIGYLQVVAALLESEGDDISPLSGLELVRQKVSHIWVMAGKWDECEGRENNFARNARSRRAGHVFCELCPVPVTFLGFEVGDTVISGRALQNGVLYDALCDHGSKNGHCSWDPMLVALALCGDAEQAGYRTVYGTASVDAETGINHFREHADGLHRYVIKQWPNERYEALLEQEIAEHTAKGELS